MKSLPMIHLTLRSSLIEPFRLSPANLRLSFANSFGYLLQGNLENLFGVGQKGLIKELSNVSK
jgi:hypothetical protein